jgi:predicted dehydrogenase
VIGLDHYHVTGWVESLEAFPDEIEIVALYEPDPEVRQSLRPRHVDPTLPTELDPRHRELPAFGELEELLAGEPIDLALVTLPNRDAPVAIERLAAAGIHMLVDKPAARSAAGARRAFGAARAAGVRVTVGLSRRVDPAWLDAHDLVAEGRIGRIVAVEALTATSSVAVRDPANALFDPVRSGHGILHWLGVHDVDGVMWVAGQPIQAVQAMTARVGDAPVQVEDAASLVVRLASGALGTIQLVNSLPRRGYLGHVAFHGVLGSIRLDQDGSLTIVGAGEGPEPLRRETRTYERPDVGGYGPGALVLIRDWLDAIREDRDPLVGGEDLVRALEVIDAAYESAVSGSRVEVTAG